jgi:hypothetical protein
MVQFVNVKLVGFGRSELLNEIGETRVFIGR